MTNEQKIFLKLVSCGINGSICNEELQIDSNVIEITNLHRCHPFAYYAALKSGIDAPKEWKYRTLYGAIDTEKKLAVQTSVVKKLEEASIKYAILKGASLLRCYSVPGIRLMGDIDVLVRESDYERAAKLISHDGDFENNTHEFHFAVDVNGVSVEIHKYVTHNIGSYNKRVLDIMADALDETELVNWDGHEFRVLKNKYQALSLLIHKLRHMDDNKFIFRLVCDWASFVSSVDEMEWKKEVYPILKKAGLHLFADAMTMCACRYLGVNNSSMVMTDIDDDVVDTLAEFLLSCGVGESKTNLTVGIGILYERNMRHSNNLIAMIKSINEISLKRFSLARYRIFLPVFWIYIPLRYLCRLVLRKRDNINYSIFAKTVNDRKKIYENLQLDYGQR